MMIDVATPPSCDTEDGLRSYYVTKIEELQLIVMDKTQNLRRLQAQRNELNAKGEFRTDTLSHAHDEFSYRMSMYQS